MSSPAVNLNMTATTALLVANLEGAGATSPSRVAQPSAAKAASEKLSVVLQAAGKPSILGTREKMQEVITVLAAYESAEVVTWLAAWIARTAASARARSRAGLLGVMQRVMAHCLDERVEAAEAILSTNVGEAPDFCTVSMLVEEKLQLNGEHRRAVCPAALWLACAAGTGTTEGAPPEAAYVVPSLDRLVLMFRHALLTDLAGMSKNLHRWRELEGECGFPALERHLPLLSCGTKAVMLAMLLVPDDVPAAVVVVDRNSVPLDRVLPDGEYACVVSPYFESSTGTKIVHGRRVEGGEGHGPRKEFFTLASSGALSRWAHLREAAPPPPPEGAMLARIDNTTRLLSLDVEAASAVMDVTQYDRVLRCLGTASVGDLLRLELAGGSHLQATVTGVPDGNRVAVREILRVPERAVVQRVMLQSSVQPLFEFHRGTGQHWFGAYADELDNPGNDSLRAKYFGFGKLLALAVANHCKIAFSLPAIFFGLLLHRGVEVPVLADLRGFDDELWASLRRCLKMRNSQFKALKELEGLDGDMSREAYVARRVASTLAPSAMLEVRRGFWSAAGGDELWNQVNAADLRQILCPADTSGQDLDIRSIFEVMMDQELIECPLFVKSFWAVVDGFKAAERRKFLLFVTGVENPPEPGTERLVIELPFSAFSNEEHENMLNMLPQAHTCSNCLELPNYYEALQATGRVQEEDGDEAMEAELQRVLGEKLRLAINETGGYELDATECEIEPLMCTLPKASTSSFPGSPLGRAEPDVGIPRADKVVGLSRSASKEIQSVTATAPGSSPIVGSPALSTRSDSLEHMSPGYVNDLRGDTVGTLVGATPLVGLGGCHKDIMRDHKAINSVSASRSMSTVQAPKLPSIETPKGLGVDDLLDELASAMAFNPQAHKGYAPHGSPQSLA